MGTDYLSILKPKTEGKENDGWGFSMGLSATHKLCILNSQVNKNILSEKVGGI